MIVTVAYILFWTSLLLMLHSYVFYPIIVLVWSSVKKKNELSVQNDLPSISLLMPVYNEEKVIVGKLKNLQELDYPIEKLEILIGSDCSTDDTPKLLESLASKNMRIFHFKERRGKAMVLNDLATSAKNEILVFSDADTFYYPDALKKMVRHFVYEDVGGVCGNLDLKSSPTNSGGRAEAKYWRYENAIKESEGKIKTTFGATGAIYAIRKKLFRPLGAKKLFADDFLIPLFVTQQGYRILYDTSARGWEETADSTVNEFQRKVRIGVANFNGLGEILPLLHPKFGFVSFGLISHKLIRWIAPFLLMIIFVTSVYLFLRGNFYLLFFVMQLIFFFLAGIGYVLDRRSKPMMLFTMPYYFFVANAGLLYGFFRFLKGTQKTTWNV